MADFAQGLGGALQQTAGIFNPQIQQMQIADQQKKKDVAAQMVMQGMQNGSITPQQGQAALQQLGFPAVPIGTSPQAKADQAFQQWLQGQSQGQQPQGQPQATQSVPPPELVAASPAAQKYVAALSQEKALTAPKAPPIRENYVKQGNQYFKVKEELQPDNTWKEIGRAPEYKPTVAVQVTPSDPDTIKSQGAMLLTGMPLSQIVPGFGAAYAAQRNKVMQEGISELKAAGMSATDAGKFIANAQRSYKAGTTALSQNEKDTAALIPYKQMLDTNVDIAIKLGQKVAQTNSALLNKNINWLRQNASNNPDVSEYLAQIRFVQTEAARVLNNPRLVGQLSDQARQEMEAVVNGNMPLESSTRVLQRIKQDGENRINAMLRVNTLLGGDLETKLSQPTAQTPAATSADAPQLPPGFQPL